jgi:hypothetical protein
MYVEVTSMIWFMVQGIRESLQFQNLFECLNCDLFVKNNFLRLDPEF